MNKTREKITSREVKSKAGVNIENQCNDLFPEGNEGDEICCELPKGHTGSHQWGNYMVMWA